MCQDLIFQSLYLYNILYYVIGRRSNLIKQSTIYPNIIVIYYLLLLTIVTAPVLMYGQGGQSSAATLKKIKNIFDKKIILCNNKMKKL